MSTLPSLLVALLLLLLAAHSPAQTPPPTPIVAGKPCSSADQRIHQEGFVPIGGIEQWITIKGARCGNPVLLFLHGGPGNPLSPFADNLYRGWEQDFTLVQWDQRGAGMTFGRSRPVEDAVLTVPQMRDDGLEVAAWVAQHLGQQKVILMSSSWSTILGIHMIRARPELFHAYVGTAHIVSYREGELATYDNLLATARAAGDVETVKRMEGLGAPPWTNPRNAGIVRRVLRKYEALTSEAPPSSWWVRAPAYATPRALEDDESGEAYSFLQFVGMKGDGMYSKVDLPALGTDFRLPIFLLQGSEDMLTLPANARRYFDSITAPVKDFVVVPRTGHDPNGPMLQAQKKVLMERVLPLAK